MVFPCPNRVPCPDDEALANLSSEQFDGPTFVKIIRGENPKDPPELGTDWDAPGCLTLCTSLVSQDDADLCALRQLPFCNGDPDDVFYNTAQTCTVDCPDGLPFSYTVPAGLFTGINQETADKLAHDWACKQAQLRIVCLSGAVCQVCVGVESTFGFQVSGSVATPLSANTWQIVSGSIPTGMVFGFSVEGLPQLSGTPTVAGTFIFTLRITTPDGDFMQKVYSVYSIAIADSALPDYEVGVAYSHQLTASGGSGNYAWRIVAGSLPDGLSMSIDGLISGTPSTNAAASFTVEVIDLTCEATDKTFYPPAVSLVSTSSTRISTILGFDEYIASTPPKRYKKAAYSGYSRARFFNNVGDAFGSVRYDFNGATEIDTTGSIISNHEKNLRTACQDSYDGPTAVPAAVLFPSARDVGKLRGYCGEWASSNLQNETITKQCSECTDPNPWELSDSGWKEWGNFAVSGTMDGADLPSAKSPIPTSAVNASIHSAGTVPYESSPVQVVSGLTVISYEFDHQYDVMLSDEYTDAEALLNSAVIVGNGRVAESRPRTKGYVSMWTSVQFTMNFTGLVVGENYVARVEFMTNTGVISTKTYTFGASSDTHQIVDAVPTPADGQTIELRKATVAYS